MRQISLIPKHNHAQGLRMRRALLAFYGYLLIAAVVIPSNYTGFAVRISTAGVLLIFFILLLANLVVFTMLYTGFNKRFKDPSLTVFQLLIGLAFCTVLAYYTANPLRGIMILLYILVLMFGVFRLRLFDFILLSVISTLMYVGAMSMLLIFHPDHASFRLEAIRTVSLLVALIWVSYISNYIATLRRKIKRIASHDELTGVYNRRELLSILEREKALAERSGVSFALCIIDIDDFKPVNDTYGHLAGDQVLKKFASTIKENIRSEDYIGRYGGEEFIVILVNCGPTDSENDPPHRILEAIRNLRLPDIDESLRVTASMGVAGFKPGESVDILIARADQALYKAKTRGKNRIEHAGQ